MNQFKTQNNLFLTIQLINVSYTVQESTEIAKLVNSLMLQYKQLTNSIEHNMDINKINEISINILSSYQQLIEQNPHLYQDYDKFINHAINTGVDFIELFQNKLIDKGGFQSSICESMVSCVCTFFNKSYTESDVNDLINKVKLFEFLTKEKLVEPRNNLTPMYFYDLGEKYFNFSDDELEEFFIDNRLNILKYIVRESTGNLVAMDNPLNTTKDSYIFNNYNSLLKFK
jgi:hypothetical protein